MTMYAEDQTRSSARGAAIHCRRPTRWHEWRRRTMAIGVGVTWALSAGVFPSTSSAGQELRIAVVDLATVTEQMPEKKAVEATVQAEAEALDIDVQNRWKELGRLSQDIKSKEKALSAEALVERQEEIIRKEKELSEYWEKRSSEIRRSATDVSGAISKLIRSSVSDMAKRKGFDLVFDRESGRLLYANDRFDHTVDLLETLTRGRGSFSSPSLSGTHATNAAAVSP